MAKDFEFISHAKEFRTALATQMHKGLTECGMLAEGYAKTKCPVSTGALRNSISYKVNEGECYVGTNTEYAPYVELGTGEYYPGGRNDSWVFQDNNGNWHRTNGQKAQPYLKPAIANHKKDYQNALKEALKG